MKHKTLYRDTRNGKLAGVCAGLAEYFTIEVWVIRLIVVSAFLFTAGFLVMLLYIAATLILDKMPEQREQQQSNYKSHNVKQKTWQPGLSAQQMLNNIDTELDLVNSNIERMETYVTSASFSIDKQFKDL